MINSLLHRIPHNRPHRQPPVFDLLLPPFELPLRVFREQGEDVVAYVTWGVCFGFFF